MLEMTDKQLEAIRGRIQDREVGTNGNCSHIYIDGKEADSSDVMFLIERLIEEVERETKKDKYIHRRQCIYCDTCGVCTNPMDTDADIVLSHSSIPPYRSDSCHMRRVIEAYNTETKEWTTLELLEEREPLKK